MREDEQGLEPPPGYLYAGAHSLRARVRDLETEAIPTAQDPGIPLWTTGRADPVTIRMPFDVWIYGVAGSALIDPVPDPASPDVTLLVSAERVPTARDGRDLFTVDWQLDGDTSYSTDGRQRMMVPASVTVGTRLVPRAMSWMLARNQVLSVRFRSMLNVIFPGEAPLFTHLREAGIVFYAVNMNDP